MSDQKINHNLNFTLLIIETENFFPLWCKNKNICIETALYLCPSFFVVAEWTENALQKSHSVNMCIIIHSLFVYCGPISREPKSRPMEWEARNKGLSSPPAWASEMLTTQPAQSLSPGFWPPMSDSWITENYSQVQEPGWLHCKKKKFCKKTVS